MEVLHSQGCPDPDTLRILRIDTLNASHHIDSFIKLDDSRAIGIIAVIALFAH